MALWQWSTTPANNASAGAIDWAEGQPPSTVNDSARQMMADVATWFASPEWINYGLTPTYVSGTQFTVVGNQTTIFSVGRRMKVSVTAGITYGTITASAFTSLTTVTVALDAGSLDSGLSEVDVGIINPFRSSVPHGSFISENQDAGGANFRAINGGYGAYLRNDGTNVWLLQTASGSPYGGFNSYQPFRWSLTTGQVVVDGSGAGASCGGNFTAGGNLTANSDERLKTDWGMLPDDFIDRLAGVRSGTYTRVDTEHRHVGVGAQSLRALLPEAVIESEKGILSVAYGQAALAACVELAKEVVRLRAMLEPLK